MSDTMPEAKILDPSEFRRSLSAFLEGLLTPEVRAAHYDPTEYGGAWSAEYRREFAKILASEGFIGQAWPVEYGGRGVGVVYDAILFDAVEYYEAPFLEPSVCYVPFTLLRYGTEWQKETFLPKLLHEGLSVFVGYSEPEAGSDLANLSTVAETVDGGYRVNGMKYFSTFAGTADYGLFAVRTKPRGERKHDNISLLLIPMDAEGVEIHEHRMMTGEGHHAVSLSNVYVEKQMLVGGEGVGWPVLMAAINYERLVIAASGQADTLVEHFRSHVMDTPNPIGADRLVTAAIEARAASLYCDSVVARAGTIDEDPGDGATVAQLMKREAVRTIEATSLPALGVASAVRSGDGSVADGRFAKGFIGDLMMEFAAGGFDITRQVIARRVLKMGKGAK
nr:acyl-CoA dehydrogenase family protein [Rhodococcus sp. (in: high G+C Gram-positive bacteria)]